MQRAMKPSPCAQPNSIVSVSKPGTSQNRISAVKIASSIHESRLTQTNSGPGTGLRSGTHGRGAYPYSGVRASRVCPGVSAVRTMRSCSRAWATE